MSRRGEVTQQLALFGPPFEHLTLDPTPAMRRGKQTVWQCSWCGCIVVTDSGKPGACPSGHCAHRPKRAPTSWWEQILPVAGICGALL